MDFIKKYKNLLILILIITSIVFSTNALDFISSTAKKVQKMFSDSKPDYSNLSSKGYKVQSSTKSSPSAKPASTNNSSKNEGARSMFKSNKKEPSPEELDKQIMADQNKKNDPRNEIFERSKRQFDKAVDQKKMSEEKFDMDMKKEFDNF